MIGPADANDKPDSNDPRYEQERVDKLRKAVDELMEAYESIKGFRDPRDRLEYEKRLVGIIVAILNGVFRVPGVQALSAIDDCDALLRNELWKCLQGVMKSLNLEEDEISGENDTKNDLSPEAVFNQWYLEQTTESLGNELDALRKDPNFSGTEADISQLISYITLGNCEEVFDSLARELVVQTLQVRDKRAARNRSGINSSNDK